MSQDPRLRARNADPRLARNNHSVGMSEPVMSTPPQYSSTSFVPPPRLQSPNPIAQSYGQTPSGGLMGGVRVRNRPLFCVVCASNQVSVSLSDLLLIANLARTIRTDPWKPTMYFPEEGSALSRQGPVQRCDYPAQLPTDPIFTPLGLLTTTCGMI